MSNSTIAGTQAVARAAALLREIAASGEHGGSLADLAARLELERPTAHRILQRLVMEKLIEQDPRSRLYFLGPLLHELGLAARPSNHLQGLASEAAAKIADECGDTVFVIVQSGMDSLCLDRQTGDYPVKALLMSPGKRRPMGTGAGSLSLLSAMPSLNAHQILESNATRLRLHGEAHVDEIKTSLKQYREEGFVMRAPTDAPEILSLSVAICNSYSTPLMALSISALKFRIEHRLDRLVSILTDSKKDLESRLVAMRTD